MNTCGRLMKSFTPYIEKLFLFIFSLHIQGSVEGPNENEMAAGSS